GVEISAVINPVDQKIRHVSAGYKEVEGVIAGVQNNNGQKKLSLAGGLGTYRILPGAIYSYANTFANTEAADAPFGAGVLEEFEEALPGVPVRLHLAPASGGIQYLAIKRQVALGTVREVVNARDEINLDNGFVCRMFPGAYVRKDRVDCSLADIKPGDHISAVLLPETGETIGLVAYSNVFYGKAIDFTNKNRTIYMLDDHGRYLSLHLPQDAVVYRWGVRSTPDAISSGSRIRVTTDPAGKVVWQLDIAETLFDQGQMRGYDNSTGTIKATEDRQYRVSGATRFFKNGYRVTPEDLLPGEYIKLEYAAAPPPTGNVLISVGASSAAQAPLMLAYAVPLPNQLVITGRTDAGNAVYIWEGSARHLAQVDDAGKFSFIMNRENEESFNLSLVAVNRQNGGVTGVQALSDSSGRGEYESAVANAFAGITEINVTGYQSGDPISRVEAAAVLARLLSWPKSSEWALPFSDAADIPAVFSPAVAEARARGIIKGYSDGSFLPERGITRAEAAVVLASVINELGVAVNTSSSLIFLDASDIPPWAVRSVAETTAAGIFADRAGENFSPWEQVTGAEFNLLLEQLLQACETLLD
ncbi:MAG: S-layer homology domain-containing protein, partial [Desulfotomaculaceae bacterium]|nr:S-layer homology domain-containing protein [Desulfotomaculaceae bacterium]